MNSRGVVFGLGLALSANVCMPLATQPGDDRIPEVTVIAPRQPTPEELSDKSVGVFIDSHAQPATVTGLLGRWRDLICPQTVGLSPAFNAFVTARLRAIAATVKAPLQETAGCRTNVAVYFTTEPQKLLDDVAKHFDVLLGFHYPHQTKKLATFNRPIQVWYVTGTHGSRGPDAIDSIWGQPAQSRPPSRLDTGGLSSVIMFSLIIVDTNKVAGLEIGAISDYIAAIALTRTRSLDDCSPLPSILDLMSAGCGSRPKPGAMTAGDLAYLHALYALDMDQPLEVQKTDLQNMMMREFTAPH